MDLFFWSIIRQGTTSEHSVLMVNDCMPPRVDALSMGILDVVVNDEWLLRLKALFEEGVFASIFFLCCFLSAIFKLR